MCLYTHRLERQIVQWCELSDHTWAAYQTVWRCPTPPPAAKSPTQIPSRRSSQTPAPP